MEKRLRFADLVALGLFNNRNTLKNWIRDYGFPTGQLTGPNTRTWSEAEIEAYIKTPPHRAEMVRRGAQAAGPPAQAFQA